jgi:hypothetical protein
MIEWDSVEAHTQHRGTPTHNAMRQIGRYQKSDGATSISIKLEIERRQDPA